MFCAGIKNRHGFTLIELMIVIVIIGVLASLALPRFMSASYKARVAEGPRVLAAYVSAQLAAIAEEGAPQPLDKLVFVEPADSKWFDYAEGDEDGILIATANSGLGELVGETLTTTVDADGNVTNVATPKIQPFVPNFK